MAKLIASPDYVDAPVEVIAGRFLGNYEDGMARHGMTLTTCSSSATAKCPSPISRTLGQLLCSLYKRGDRWVDELDDGHLMCRVNGREARLFDTIAPGAEICISSKKPT